MRAVNFHLVWNLARSLFLRSNCQGSSPQQTSTQHPHLLSNEKAQTERPSVPENGWFPCAIDGLRMFATGAGLSSLISWVLGAVLVVSKRFTFLERRMHHDRSRDSMSHSLQSRRDYRCRLFLFPNRTISASPLVRKSLQRLTFFCQVKLTKLGTTYPKYNLFCQ